MRDCPIFEVDITEERTTQIYVAAATALAAQEIAEKIAAKEIDWFGAINEYHANAYLTAASEHDVRNYGIWVDNLLGDTGGWVHSYDDVPQLAPLPDPNQCIFDLGPEFLPITAPSDAVPAAALKIVSPIQAIGLRRIRL